MAKPALITTELVLKTPYRHEDSAKVQKRDAILRIVGLVFVYAFLILAAALVLFPFYYMIIASFMDEADVLAGKFFPETGNWLETIANNYTQTIDRLNYFKRVGNTLVVAFTTTIAQMLTTILAAYAFARLKFKGRDALFMVFLATMMVPGEVLAVSNYITVSNLGLTGAEQDQWKAFFVMIVPLVSSVFYIYLLRQNFKQIPNELYLASKVDGKSDWEYLWKVMVPLAAPTLITIGILSLINSWNSYVWPSLAVSNNDYTVISVAIRKGNLTIPGPGGVDVTQYSWQMAASVLTVVPLLLMFILFRKYIMSGTGRAGIKG